MSVTGVIDLDVAVPGWPTDEVVAAQLWLAAADGPGRTRLDLLGAVEHERRDRLVVAADRDRFTVAAALVRTVVGERLGVDPAGVDVDRTCDRCSAAHGRPKLPGTGLHVSISHSGDLVAVALTDAGPIGVDVEECLPRDSAGLADVVLGLGEHADGPADFYTYWCRKEAVVKATGAGLRMPLVEVLVTGPDAPPALRAYGPDRPDCAMADLTLPPRFAGYAGCLAVLAPGVLRVEQFGPGLG